MHKKSKPHDNIHGALQLDGQPDTMIEYYKKWSETYDTDVTENYFGISYLCELMHAQLSNVKSHNNQISPQQTKIVDVGCGTGLLGKPLYDLGYRLIDGIDLSPEMIEKAKLSGFYTNLYDGINIHQTLPEPLQHVYDVVICIGVFTPGHIEPESLYQLASLTVSGGLIVASTRVPYYDTTHFQAVSDQMESEGILTLRKRQMNAPYRDDGDAHYWVYEVN